MDISTNNEEAFAKIITKINNELPSKRTINKSSRFDSNFSLFGK